ncbi:disease resistance protein (TIR-NBS-LRR class) [Medicago truncatula]|uniref:Disease resistance protein (TIR-NBS-LRR class) n=1 Tax=Medicago truncatula TaxID=3880 RepID=G7K8D6_MEDTR|nr:disease resistance protein (TIR-NBS-LRR class) [Medicago truncatula]
MKLSCYIYQKSQEETINKVENSKYVKRYNFTSHLHSCLTRFQIKTYIDYNLVRGDEISNALLRAIEESKLSVVVLSENYANSKWCLDELVKILDCKRNNVRNQTGSYGIAFAKHEKQFRNNMNKVLLRWRSALAEVTNLAGWDCSITRDVYVGDIDEEINKYEQLSNLQSMNLMLGSGFNTQLWHDLQATNQHLGQLRMKKNVILLRLPRGV